MIRSGSVRFYDRLRPLLRPIGDAQPHPENDNEGDLDSVQHSIEQNGMYAPIKVQASTGYIVAGNTTWAACVNLGATECPMVMLDIDDTTARRILLDDNHTARLAIKDQQATLALLAKIREAEGTLAHTTYSDFDRETLERLAQMPLRFDEHATWPTLSVRVHPSLLKAFRHITREADNDQDRFEVLLRLAGWDGS